MSYTFKSIAFPEPSVGVNYEKEKYIVQPDQSMSLEEIIDRFVRGEPLDVGMTTAYGDEEIDNPLNVDLEKLVHADLVDRQAYYDQLEELVKTYKKREKESEDAKAAEEEQARIKAEEERIEARAKQIAAGKAAPSA